MNFLFSNLDVYQGSNVRSPLNIIKSAYFHLLASLSFTYQTPKVLAFAFSVIAFLACLFFRSLTAGLILAMTLGAYLALRKIQSRSAVKQRLVGRFEQLSKQEITRHEKLFIVLRRTHELEQLERGFRLYGSFEVSLPVK